MSLGLVDITFDGLLLGEKDGSIDESLTNLFVVKILGKTENTFDGDMLALVIGS